MAKIKIGYQVRCYKEKEIETNLDIKKDFVLLCKNLKDEEPMLIEETEIFIDEKGNLYTW